MAPKLGLRRRNQARKARTETIESLVERELSRRRLECLEIEHRESKHLQSPQVESRNSKKQLKGSRQNPFTERKLINSEECSSKIGLNEDLVDTQSLQPHDLAKEDQSLSVILQPPSLDRNFCSYEEQKMFMNFYGDHRELFLPDCKMNIGKRDDSYAEENMNSLSQKLFIRESGSKYKLCLLYGRPNGMKIFTLLVIEIGENGFLGEETYSTISLSFWRPGIGFGSVGSKCYVVGGDAYAYNVDNQKFLDVYTCDLSRQTMSWEKGPALNGEKPNPIIVTVNGKLYSLAGSSGIWSRPDQRLEYMFEVLDPEIGTWRILPEPPFLSLYEKSDEHPEFLGHTVIGLVIYFQLGPDGNQTLFTFNVDSEQWGEFGADDDDLSSTNGSDEIIFHNLRVGDWQNRTDVVDYLMFRTSGHELENLTVYAYDLTSRIEDHDYYYHGDAAVFHDGDESEESSEDNEDELRGQSKYIRQDFMDEEYVLLLDDKLVTVPVLGLTLIPRYIPGRTQFDAFVSHLGDDLFALVCTMPSRILGEKLDDTKYCWRVRAAIFKAIEVEQSQETKYKERYVAAYNVRDVTWPIPEMALLHGWCKVPNDGRQSQFRRPQSQHRSCSYYDGVAGQVVQKKHTSRFYVQRANIPQTK